MPTPLDRWRRRLAAAAYALFAIAGVANIFDITHAITNVSSLAFVILWIACLIAGGSAGTFGALSRRPIPEISGIITISTAILVYSVAVSALAPLFTGRTILVLAILAAILALLGLRVLELTRTMRLQDRIDHTKGKGRK